MLPAAVLSLLAGAVAPVATPPALDTRAIEQTLGLTGTLSEGVFKLSKPRDDVRVAVDGFAITPRMGLTAWMAFRPHGPGAMLMGDLPLLADEIQPVLSALAEGGVEVSALHNHFVGEEPRVMFLHVAGEADAVRLARGLKGAFDAIARVRGPATTGPVELRSQLDAARLDALLGLRGELQQGVYKIVVPRADVSLREMGEEIGPVMGFNSWAAFEGTAEKAAVSGDTAMRAEEVNPVVRALRAAGIGVVAIHNHMLREEPRIFFLHFWGVGRADDLARSVRAALDKLGHVPR